MAREIEPIDDIGRAYFQSRDDLAELPQTREAPIERNLPNIFRINRDRIPDIWIQSPDLIQKFVKATKADIGGVGGHVEVSEQVKAKVLEYVLKYNRFDGRPLFTSIIATHTGDDIAITGVIDEHFYEHQEIVDELLWDAFQKGTKVAEELGLYGPGQDLRADAFTGNLHGLGPASVVLPLPVRERDFSQTVLLAFGDKTEPGTFNYLTTGAYLDDNFNTGLLVAKSAMSEGYAFEIVDLDTRAQALESGIPANDKDALNRKMEELGKTERFIVLKAPEDFYQIKRLTKQVSRYVISRVFTKDKDGNPDQLGAVVSAERLHNIPNKKGEFVYGGKDDPVMLALCQGDWPAPGEITSPIARTPLVAGDCRGSHYLPVFPIPINEQTSFWSGPIMSVVTMSINIKTGRIGDISDQFARGTPWDAYRANASQYMLWFRTAHGSKEPATLGASEMEYQEGYMREIGKLNRLFTRRDPKTK